MDKEVAVLISGGIDSLVALNHAIKVYGTSNVVAVYVDVGQPYKKKEESFLASYFDSPSNKDIQFVKVKADLALPQLNNVPTIESQEIFGRNLLLAFYGSLLAKRVWLSSLATEINATAVRDKQPEFMHMTTALMTFLMKNRRMETIIESPFDTLTKTEVVRYAITHFSKVAIRLKGVALMGLGMQEKDILNSVSCYDPDHHSCGKCSTCAKRWIAFQNNGLADAQNWAFDPTKNKYLKEITYLMRKEVNKGVKETPFSRFSEARKRETHNALINKGLRGIYT